MTYFFQGFRQYSTGGAVSWYLRQLRLDSGSVQQARSTVLISFNIKFLYGLVFDNAPVFGRHHKPWYMFSAFIGLVAFILLGIPEVTTSLNTVVGLLFMAVASQAMTDTVADGLVVKNARMAGARGGAGLQSFCWSMFFIGQLIGTPTAGRINGPGGAGSRDLMRFLYAPASLVLVIIALFLKEERTDKKWSPKTVVTNFWRLVSGILLNFKVLLPMTWIVLRGLVVPDIGDAYDFWLFDRPEGGVKIGADLQAYLSAIGSVFSLIGTLLFARFFTTTPFRKIFFWSTFVVGCLGILDVALYKGWNRAVGISDIPFLFGNYAIAFAISRLSDMPFLVMAAQLCPADIEATFFATLMSLSNAGYNASTRWGGILLQALGVDFVDQETGERTYDLVKLEQAIWIRFGLAFLPCILVLFLVPNASAIDPHNEENGEKDPITTAERDALETAAANGDVEAAAQLKKEDEKAATA
jgi:MFS family permease